MFESFPQLVPQETCLSCDGCCRFEHEESGWRPKVSKEDRIEGFDVDSNNYLKAVTLNDICRCTYFDRKNNVCLIYNRRPFECQIYPVLIVEHALGVDVSIHLSCPYVQRIHDTAEFDHYCTQIKEFFEKKEVREFLRNNKQLAGDYEKHKDEIESVFVLGL